VGTAIAPRSKHPRKLNVNSGPFSAIIKTRSPKEVETSNADYIRTSF